MRQLGREPVWFENIDGAGFEGSREVAVVVQKPAPSDAERKKLAAQPEEERLAAIAAKAEKDKPKDSKLPEGESSEGAERDAAKDGNVDAGFRDGADNVDVPEASPIAEKPHGFFGGRKNK